MLTAELLLTIFSFGLLITGIAFKAILEARDEISEKESRAENKKASFPIHALSKRETEFR